VWPLEQLALAVSRRFMAATEGVDSVLNNLGSAIFWPFRMFGRAIAALGRLVLPTVVRESLAGAGERVLAIPRRCFGLLLRASEALNLDGPLRWLVWLLQPLWRPVAALGGFLYAWFATRQWRQLLWGLPAALMLVPVVLIWAYITWVGKGQVVSRYQLAVKEALELREYDRANLYERKLAQLGVDTQRTEYRTALALAEEEKHDEAYERMLRLAPEERPGYPAAHHWIVHQLMNGKIVEDSDEARRLAKVHLDHLETLQITGPYQQYLGAMWLVQGGELEAAAEKLEPLVPALPSAAFERLRLDVALRRPEQARQDARALVTHMTGLERRGTELGSSEFQQWLAAEEVLGNWQKMRSILERWLEVEPENEAARRSMAAVSFRLAAQMLREPLPDSAKIAQFWLTALEMNSDPELLNNMARSLYASRNQTPAVRGVLDAFIDLPETPAELLLVVGTEAAVQQQVDDARRFLAAVVQRDASNPVAWNNLGLMLSEGPDADLEKALDAVNRALELAPREYRFHETRGQILVRLGRWEAAVEDLEFALNGLPKLSAIHESLATAYKELGNTELARLHLDQSE